MEPVPRPGGASLVGREREVGRLGEVLALAARGQPQAVIVHGEAGVGKTRLVQEACATARSAGHVVLWGTCVRFGAASLPYAPLASALDGWAAGAERTVRAGAFAGLRGLVDLLPSMGVRSGELALGTVPAWIETVLLRIAAQSPTVLVVDDLQWADSASLDALAYLITGSAAHRLTILATIRLEERPEGHPLHTWLADVRRLPHVWELTLERLGLRETQAQVEALLGDTVPEEYVEDVHRRSRGNAYLTELLVKDAPADPRRLPTETSQALREAVLARWHRLSGPAREVTRLLAIGGRPASAELLTSVAAGSPAPERFEDLTGLLREAIDAGVLSRGGDRTYWFWHPLLPEVLLGSVADGGRAGVHALYAAGLEAVAGPGPTALAADLAVHHESAGHLDEAFGWSLHAADYAARVSARAEESAHLTHACALWDAVTESLRGSPSERVALLRRAAAAAYAIGDHVTAADRLAEALELVDPDEDPLTTSALLVDWTRVDWERSPGHLWFRPEMVTAVGLTDDHPDSEERAIALSRLAEAQVWDNVPGPLDATTPDAAPAPGRTAAEQALEVAERSGSPLARAHALTAHAMALLSDPGSDALAELEEAAELSRGIDATWVAEACTWQINRLQAEGRIEEAAALGAAGAAEALQQGSVHHGHFLAAHGALCLIDLGRWDEARELVRPALGSGGIGITGAFARCDAALLAVRSGQTSQARRHLERVAELVRPDFTGVPITAVTIEVMLAEGRPREALDHIDAQWHLHAADLNSDGVDPLLVGGATAAADWAEQARDRGDEGGCAAALAALEDLTARGSSRRMPFRSAFASDRTKVVAGLRFAAEGERCRAGAGQADAWLRVRDEARAAGLRWEQARAAFRQGHALLSPPTDRPAAAAALREAHAVATELGATPLREDVESLARTARIPLDAVTEREAPETAHGEGPATEVRPALLTEREQEVLRHLMAGRSNGEIAGALFISTKTVSVHVSNILRKTGTSSRIEAAEWARRVLRS